MSRKNYKKKSAPKKQPQNTTAAAPVAEVETKETPVDNTTEAPVADTTEPTPEQEVHKTEWKPIIKDFVILLIIMGILGYACNLLKDAFAHKSPTDSLVSLIRKGDVKDVNGEEKDEPFLKEIEEGIKENADFVNTRDANQRTPLMWAAYANFNDPEKAEETDINRIYYIDVLFEKHANIHATDEDGFNALHWAAWSGMRFTAYKLYERGIDINQPENNGYTPLMLAAMRGNDAVVDLLLKLGANPNAQNKDGLTAAQLANNAAIAYSKRNSWIYGPVYSENREKSYAKTCQLLADSKGELAQEERKKLQVELEIEMNESVAVARAERKIAALAKKDETRSTISLIPLVSLPESDYTLHHRVKAEAAAIQAAEKEYAMTESPLNKTDAAGNTALHIAARDGKAYCCYHLLNVGLSVAKKNNEGKTPLMLAVANGHLAVVEVIVNADKAEVKEAAAEALKMLETMPDVPNAESMAALLKACRPMVSSLKDAEFEHLREAKDPEYAKAKAAAAAKAKADEEARIKAEEEARAKAAAEAKAREDALALAEKTAAEKIVAAEQATKQANENSAMAVQAMNAADKARTEAEQAKSAAVSAKAESDAATTAANSAKAEALAATEAAQNAKAEAEAATAAANAAKTEAESAKTAAEQAKAEAEAAKQEYEAAKAALEAPVAPVEEQPAA